MRRASERTPIVRQKQHGTGHTRSFGGGLRNPGGYQRRFSAASGMDAFRFPARRPWCVRSAVCVDTDSAEVGELFRSRRTHSFGTVPPEHHHRHGSRSPRDAPFVQPRRVRILANSFPRTHGAICPLPFHYDTAGCVTAACREQDPPILIWSSLCLLPLPVWLSA